MSSETHQHLWRSSTVDGDTLDTLADLRGCESRREYINLLVREDAQRLADRHDDMGEDAPDLPVALLGP